MFTKVTSTTTLSSILLISLSLFHLCNAQATYTLVDDYTASPVDFFESFNFFTGADPTNGFVAYTDAASAAESNLIGFTVPETTTSISEFANASSIYVGVDYTNVISSGSGRPSVRITSTKSYNAGILLVADILHMPTGCGTWSSLWMLGGAYDDVWPLKGELDIIENVNLANADEISLHTNVGCVVDNNTATAFTGTMLTDNCDVNAEGQDENQGCTVQAPTSSTSPSFGADFNTAGGGVYAVEWTNDGFSIWFFGRSEAMPESLLTDSPDPSTFGMPITQFTGSGCDFAEHFQDMSIVLDTTFCGAWAGNVWESGGCAASTGTSTCDAYVAANPAEFQQAYWEISGLRVYGQNGGASNATVLRRDADVVSTDEVDSQRMARPILVVEQRQSGGARHAVKWLVVFFVLLVQVVLRVLLTAPADIW